MLPSPLRLARPGALLVLAALLAACSPDSDTPESAPSLTVSVATPVRQALPRHIDAAGAIAAWEEMSLGVELSGQRVEAVLVEVGDVVERGQPLLRLDRRQLAMELRQAEAALAQAEASLALTSANARRGEQLREQRLVSASEADQLLANELAARAQRQSAQAQRDNARLRLGFATLVAPDAGVVSARAVQPGQVVSAGAELLRLIRQGRLEWRAQLPEQQLVQVRAGAAVQVPGPDGAPVAGQVRAVSPALDAASRTGAIYADLPEPGTLRAGMFAEGRILLGERQALTIPAQAVVERDGHRYVFVLGEGDVAQQRRVALDGGDDGLLAVREGLEAGEAVVVQGAGFLADGDRVRVVPADQD